MSESHHPHPHHHHHRRHHGHHHDGPLPPRGQRALTLGHISESRLFLATWFSKSQYVTPDRACGRRERARDDVQLRHTSTVRLKQNGAGCWEELLVHYKYCMYVCKYKYISVSVYVYIG